MRRLLGTCILAIFLSCLASGCGGGGGNLPVQPGNSGGGQSGGSDPSSTPPAQLLHDVVMRPQEPLDDNPRGISLAGPRGLLDLLPDLADGERDLSCLGTGWYIEGSAYADELAQQGMSRTGDEQTDGEYSSSGSTTSTGAYAIYRWNLRNFSGSQTIGFNWIQDSAPVDWGNFYVGLGNLQLDRWQFFEGPADGVLTIDSFGPYRAADGDMLMAVLLLGDQVASLDYMEAGVPEQRATGAEQLAPEGTPDFPLLAGGGGLPDSFDLSELCAPINDQSPWGSCTAFAVGDGAYNYELQQTYGAYGWDISQPRFRVSPKHLYVVSGELQGFPPGGGTGRWTSEVIADLVTNGVATELNAPYDRNYDNNWSAEALADAAVLEIEGWKEVPCNTEEGIETVKQVLSQQLKVLPMQAWLDSSFFSVGPEDTWYYSTYFSGGHAMCIVGYDDSRGASGAFKVRNSWSEYWGDEGHVWIGYETFLDPRAAIRCWTITEEYAEYVADYFGLDVGSGTPVTGVSASKGTNENGILVNWSQQPGAGSYTILRDDKSNVVATVQAPATSWLDDGISDSYGHVYWLKVGEGPFSSPDVGYVAATPQVFGIVPKTGVEGEELSISAALNGSHPLSYSWDFGSGASPSTSSDARPLVSLGSPGSHSCSLQVTNPLGSDTFNFVLEVTPLPTIISAIGGSSGFSGTQTQLSAVVSGSPTSYSWDFGGGASPGTSSEAQPQVTLAAPGLYEASLEVGNGEMTDIYNFTLAVVDGDPQPWSQVGFGTRNSHHSPVNGPAGNNLKWKFNAQFPLVDTGTRRVSTVLELPSGDIVFSCGKFEDGGTLYCTGSDGTPKWAHTFNGQGGIGQPLLSLDSSRVYVVFNGTVLCYDAGSGAELWTAPPVDGQYYSLISEAPNGQLYVMLSGKWLMSLDAADGSVVLSEVLVSDRYNEVRFGQLAPNGRLFLPGKMGYDRLVVSFDTTTNTPSDTERLPYEATGMAVAPDGITLVVTDSQGDVRALDTFTCQQLWLQKDIPGGGQAPCITADGTVVVSNRFGIVSGLDILDGSVKWDHDLGLDGDARSYPAIGRDGTVYIGGDDQRTYAIRDGALLWVSGLSSSRYFNGGASIGSDGTLYIGDEAGWLWAFGPGSGEVISRPVIDQVAPTSGDSGEQLTITAYLDQGTEPLAWSWDFGGGASPDISTDAQPLVTLGEIGSYSGSVQVSNAWGTDSLEFTLEVKDPNEQPTWQSHEIDLVGQLNDAFASAGIVDGKPAFFMIRENSPDPFLYYYESSQAEPSLDIHWTRTTISDDGWIDNHVSMAVLGGEPAAAYVYDNQTLRLSSRSAGTWSSHALQTGNFVGDRVSLANVNGLPAVAFANYDDGSWPLGYAYADVAAPDETADWTLMDYTDVGIDSGRVYLSDNGGLPQVGFITRDAGDVFHVTVALADTAVPTGNGNWSSHYVYSGINYRDRMLMSQSGGLPQISFTLHDTVDDQLFHAQATTAVPGSDADWNIYGMHTGGQIEIERLYSSGGKPALCWSDDSPSPVGLAYSNVANPTMDTDWEIEQHALGIQVLAMLEVAGNPVLIALLPPDNELRYYVLK